MIDPPTQSDAYVPTDRNRVRRQPDRATYDRAAVHAILDEGLVAHVGIVQDGQPFVLPMVYARDGERLLLHGSVASRLARHLGGGTPVCVTVTLLDGLVMARSAFHHSMNYRSVVIVGEARRVTDPADVAAGFAQLVEHVAQGRSDEVRLPNDIETRQTVLLEVPIVEAAAKARTGGPKEDPIDLDSPTWGGVVPVRVTFGEAEADGDTPAGIAPPTRSSATAGRPVTPRRRRLGTHGAPVGSGRSRSTGRAPTRHPCRSSVTPTAEPSHLAPRPSRSACSTACIAATSTCSQPCDAKRPPTTS